MSGPYDLSSDDRLAIALREVSEMRVQFDMEEEVRKATEAYLAGAKRNLERQVDE